MSLTYHLWMNTPRFLLMIKHAWFGKLYNQLLSLALTDTRSNRIMMPTDIRCLVNAIPTLLLRFYVRMTYHFRNRQRLCAESTMTSKPWNRRSQLTHLEFPIKMIIARILSVSVLYQKLAIKSNNLTYSSLMDLATNKQFWTYSKSEPRNAS
jgi:hypothetical protein